MYISYLYIWIFLIVHKIILISKILGLNFKNNVIIGIKIIWNFGIQEPEISISIHIIVHCNVFFFFFSIYKRKFLIIPEILAKVTHTYLNIDVALWIFDDILVTFWEQYWNNSNRNKNEHFSFSEMLHIKLYSGIW